MVSPPLNFVIEDTILPPQNTEEAVSEWKKSISQWELKFLVDLRNFHFLFLEEMLYPIFRMNFFSFFIEMNSHYLAENIYWNRIKYFAVFIIVFDLNPSAPDWNQIITDRGCNKFVELVNSLTVSLDMHEAGSWRINSSRGRLLSLTRYNESFSTFCRW